MITDQPTNQPPSQHVPVAYAENCLRELEATPDKLLHGFDIVTQSRISNT